MKREPFSKKLERMCTTQELASITLFIIWCISFGISIGGALANNPRVMLGGAILCAILYCINLLIKQYADEINKL